MFRLIVGVLAAFVGFSFGHSIPKWMENKTKSATELQSSSSCESAHPVRKLLLRRKSLRKFKFGSQKSGKENLEVDESLQQLSKDIGECNAPLKCSPNSSVCASMRVRTEHQKLKLGSQKLLKEKKNKESSFKGCDSNPDLSLSAVNMYDGSCPHLNVSTNVDNGCCSLHDASAKIGKGHGLPQEMCTKSEIGHQDLHVEDGLLVESKLDEPVFCKTVKEKSQMKQWKMKLMSLRSKAMASEKVWYEKFENDKRGANLLVPPSKGVAKKQAKGKENESPQLTSSKRRDLSWSRSSSSKVSLLVEGPKSAFER